MRKPIPNTISHHPPLPRLLLDSSIPLRHDRLPILIQLNHLLNALFHIHIHNLASLDPRSHLRPLLRNSNSLSRPFPIRSSLLRIPRCLDDVCFVVDATLPGAWEPPGDEAEADDDDAGEGTDGDGPAGCASHCERGGGGGEEGGEVRLRLVKWRVERGGVWG